MCLRAFFGNNDDEELLPIRDGELNPLVSHPIESLYGLNYAVQVIKKTNPLNEIDERYQLDATIYLL